MPAGRSTARPRLVSQAWAGVCWKCGKGFNSRFVMKSSQRIGQHVGCGVCEKEHARMTLRLLARANEDSK